MDSIDDSVPLIIVVWCIWKCIECARSNANERRMGTFSKETTFQWSEAINVQSCFPCNFENQPRLAVKCSACSMLAVHHSQHVEDDSGMNMCRNMLKANQIHTLWDFIDFLNLNSKLKMFIVLRWLTRWPAAIVLAFHACVNPFDNSNSTAQWSSQIAP